ncbi:MAG: hypothetical protein JXR25_13315 [Pontiellaceae bacterium]|nr:hypothetical protein [Candidatus Anaeroferrophillacea bacterium]MBN2785794.1 hypothetical protein [Pontiellaceae bacterium]
MAIPGFTGRVTWDTEKGQIYFFRISLLRRLRDIGTHCRADLHRPGAENGGGAAEAHLVISDRDSDRAWDEKITFSWAGHGARRIGMWEVWMKMKLLRNHLDMCRTSANHHNHIARRPPDAVPAVHR